MTSSAVSVLPSPIRTICAIEKEKEEILRQADYYLGANIRLFSACEDEQQTIDCSNVKQKFNLRESKRAFQANGEDGGVCTSVMLKFLYMYHSNREDNGVPTYSKLLNQVRNALKKKGYQQLPMLTSSRPVKMTDEFNIIPKNFNGTRKALIIGINYAGTAFEIPGCQNDAWNIITYLKVAHGFEDDDFIILMDDGVRTNPTRENIIKAFHRFAFSVKPGDAVFFYYAGHGRNKIDINDDESCGFDQALMPVDYLETDDIVDDEIFRVLLIPLPKGLEMTAIVDCCHSGSIFDLPFEFVGDAEKDGKEMKSGKVRFPHMKLVKYEKRRIQAMTALKKRASQIELVMLEPPKKRGGRTKNSAGSVQSGGSRTSKKSTGSRTSKKSTGSRTSQPKRRHLRVAKTEASSLTEKLQKVNANIEAPEKTEILQQEEARTEAPEKTEELQKVEAKTEAPEKTEKLQKVEEKTGIGTTLFGCFLLLMNPCRLYRVMSS